MTGLLRIMSDSLKDLTILVPSKNGLTRLKFLCDWLKANHFDGCYLIIDGTTNSQEAHFAEFEFVNYVHKADCNPVEALTIGSKFIKSEFSTFLGDDDIPFLKNYKKLVGFLKSNSDYDSARGCSSYINFDELSSREPLGRFAKLLFFSRTILSSRYDSNTNLDHKDGLDRLRAMSKTYIVNQFFITKSSIIKKLYNREFSNLSDVHISEYAFNLSHALFARTRYIPILYMVRGLANHRPNDNSDDIRHKMDISGKVEKELKLYVDSLNIESPIKPIMYRMILSKRYVSENSRLLRSSRNSAWWFFLYRANQVFFSLSHQTKERWALVFFKQNSN